ncbi:MAG: 16S rRNA (adenine(1518)-N(6)/adenine(1519)-N(6))-dimethyltransferase RsmA [Candidatus Shikimatogenerans bostrichidophilus]|nr:MAG: 16S rRNA (adenine(1518)-N(6)/adenine(1519)-N(6))-dimethyltransferase RsmA [Candidatus Shikimatogenerans bostrichidophilus]
MYYNKKYSQTFLINKDKIINIVKTIIKNKIKYNYLLEIGPGLGNITKKLVKNINKRYYLVEIDKRFFKFLKKKYKNNNTVIINDSILNIKLENINKYKKFYIIGNLPYHISSKLIIWLINNRNNISKCTCMFQEEFIKNLLYDKLKYNSRLSLLFNMYYKLKIKNKFLKEDFYPIPKVNSILVNIMPKNIKYNININKFKKFIKEIFKYKRKILKNSFKRIYKKKYKYDNPIFYKRPEDLTLNEYLIIYKIYRNEI